MIIPRNQYTLMGDAQWRVLHQVADMVDGLSGEIAEVGVYRGGSALFWCERFPKNVIILIDSFTGIPNVPRIDLDGHPAGDFSCPVSEVVKILPPNAELHAIIYPNIQSDPLVGKTLKLLHLDVDIYWSIRYALELNWSRMVRGGVVLFDDYNGLACRGVQKAVNEFCIRYGIPINTTKDTPQAWIVKND